MTLDPPFSIRRRLIFIGLVTVGLALFLSSTGALLATFAIGRQALVNDVVAQATLMADNVAAAVAFGDKAAAHDAVALFAEKVSIDLACVFDRHGARFAHYQEPTRGQLCPAESPPDGLVQTWRSVVTIVPVSVPAGRVGTLYIHGNFDPIWEQLSGQTAGAIIGLLLGAGGALLSMTRLHRTLVDPLAELAGVSERVSVHKDYSARATKYADDEIGAVVDAFNQMLEQVQRRETERSVLLAREREASRLKDEFLAAVSHELRTPLNAVLGWAQLLDGHPLDPETSAKGLSSIRRNAEAQARLIEDLLDISRIVSGKFHLKTQAIDIAATILAAVDVVRPAATAKGISISTRDVGSCRLTADPERLQQVFWNLLSNAVKFTPRFGRIEIVADSSQGLCRVSVRDTGIGIAPDFLPHVFDRFRQADGSSTREYGGLGLGLAIVHEIVRLHGGVVSAFSEGRDNGSTFTVELPLLSSPDFPISPAPVSEEPAGVLHGRRFLVVDDDQDSRNIADVVLRSVGAAVVTVGSPAEALEMFSNGQQFTAILCDIGMQQMDGYELIRAIHAKEAGHRRRTPAIAVTAYAGPADIEKARAAGFGWHLAKPVAVPELVRVATEAANSRRTPGPADWLSPREAAS